jgi:hypothetical protein
MPFKQRIQTGDPDLKILRITGSHTSTQNV